MDTRGRGEKEGDSGGVLALRPIAASAGIVRTQTSHLIGAHKQGKNGPDGLEGRWALTRLAVPLKSTALLLRLTHTSGMATKL
jgi:hypothetical protein